MFKCLFTAAFLAGFAAVASAQTAPGAGDGGDENDLAKKLSNPVADLISVPFQYNYNDGYLDGSGVQSYINIQPVIPISISDNWNLISRTILPVVNLDGFQGEGSSQTGLGNTLQSFFFSPKKPTSGGLIWGVGPAIQIPTATNGIANNQWGLGITGVVLRQSKGWTIGALANHVWSVSNNDKFGETSATFLQPFVSFTTKKATTYSINTESTYNWVTEEWSVPINIAVAQIIKIDKHPVQIQGGLRYWVDAPEGGPQGWGARVAVTYLFPKKG
jgi:hypothetical protein